MEFENAVSVVIKLEGGLVDDANDPGGITKWGISKRAFPDIDIANLTEEQARIIYFNHYWVPAKCALMPQRLRLIYFDMCVLHGLNAAAVTLQKALNNVGQHVEIDGVIGYETLNAAVYLEPDRLRSYRVLRLSNIIQNKPLMEKFWYGWYKRASTV